jgi:hypothetical protein
VQKKPREDTRKLLDSGECRQHGAYCHIGHLKQYEDSPLTEYFEEGGEGEEEGNIRDRSSM